MNKEELLYYWSAVNSITENLKDPSVNRWAKENCDKFTPMTIGCDEVAIFYIGNTILIGINGSDKDGEEWRRNVKAFPITEGCLCGFYEDGMKMLHTVIKEIGYDYEKYTYYIPCHSRGGGLGQILGDNSEEEYGVKMHVVSDGSLNPFTWKKSRKCTFKHTRVFSQGDPVASIPFWWIPPFFKPYSTEEIKIKNKVRDLFTKKERKAIRKDKSTNMIKEIVKLRHGDYGEMIRRFMK